MQVNTTTWKLSALDDYLISGYFEIRRKTLSTKILTSAKLVHWMGIQIGGIEYAGQLKQDPCNSKWIRNHIRVHQFEWWMWKGHICYCV